MKEDWKETNICEIAKVISGYAFKKNDFVSEGIPIIKIKNISLEYIKKEDLSFVDKRFLDKLDPKFQICKGDVLISLTGSHITQPNSVVGRVARFNETKNYLLNLALL